MAEDSNDQVGWSVPPASLTERGEEVKTALAEGSGASSSSAHLTEQGEAVKEDLMVGQDNPWPARPSGYHMTPQAQATLKALRGH